MAHRRAMRPSRAVAEPLAKQIGAAVRRCRERAEISQEALAERVDVSTQFVSMIENGRRLPSLRALDRLAQALGIAIAELVGAPPSQPSAEEAEIVRALRALDARDRATALALIRSLGALRTPARRPTP